MLKKLINKMSTAKAGLLTLMTFAFMVAGTAHAAVDAAVTTAIETAGADVVTVIGALIVAAAGILAVKWVYQKVRGS